MQGWVSKPNKTVSVTSTLAGGVNQSVDPIEIPEGQVAYSMNMDTFLAPTLQTTDGYTRLATLSFSTDSFFRIGTKLYITTDAGIYELLPGGGATQKYNSTNPGIGNKLWSVAKFFDGSSVYFVQDYGRLTFFDGTTAQDVTSAPIDQSFVAAYSNRFFSASRKDNLLHYSGLRAPTDWSSTDPYVGSGKIAADTDDGEHPTGLVNFGGSLILFKRKTMHKLLGDDSTNFALIQPFNIGCISSHAITQANGILYFLGMDGVYAYDGGNPPAKISQDIEPEIRNINLSAAVYCNMASDGRFLYLALATGTDIRTNRTYKFDLQGGQWSRMEYDIYSFYLDDKTMYASTRQGAIIRFGAEKFDQTPISWEVRTKPYSDGDETTRLAINRLYAIVDVDPGATLEIHYALGAEGEDWMLAYSTTNGTGQAQSLRIPVIVRQPTNWYRVRLRGLGRTKIHRLLRESQRRGN